jgi:hypothetical protein
MALLVCSVVAGALAPPASSAAVAPRAFFGVNPSSIPTSEQMARAARGGVGSVRYSLNWHDSQSVQGAPINFGYFDDLVGRAASAGVDVLPVLSGVPGWAGRSAELPIGTPAQRDGWANFVSSAVRRYGPGGDFWVEHGPATPEPLPYHPVRNWQVWNEQNYFYFTSHPNPRLYAKFLRISSPAIKGVDPGAHIMLGGMFGRPNPAVVGGQAIAAAHFLERLYRVKGVKALFDGVALHPYTRTAKLMAPQIREIRKVMRAGGDGKTGLYITEMGWGSGGDSPLDKSPQGQANELKRAYGLLIRNRKAWRLKGTYWFSLSDQPPNSGCIFCDSTGLFTNAFEPKPAWFAFVAAAGGRP